MRKRSKILAIALLTIATACCCALSSIFAFANTVPNSNLTTWGDAEAGDSEGLTAVTTEKFEGEKSFEFSGTKKIRIKISSDGTLYQVSLKVKAAAQDTTFSLKAIGTHKDVEGNYAYTNHGGTSVTLTDAWTDYTFTLAYRYNADEKIIYYSNDGKNESKKENIEKALLGFDLEFNASATVYMDNIAVEVVNTEEEKEEDVLGEVIFKTDFENGADGFGVDGTNFGRGVIVDKTTDANGVYNGNQSLKVVTGYSRNKAISGDWITKGDFFNFKAYAKLADGTGSTAKVQLKLWEVAGGKQAQLSDLIVVPAQKIGSDWVELNYTVGLYTVDGKVYAYHKGGELELIKESGTDSIKGQTYLDIITTVGSIYFDDITLAKCTTSKNATVTVVDANGAAVSGATLVVKDAEGNALEVQPEITENEGVYTIKGLKYSNFAQKYTVCVGEETCTVDFINAEGNITVTATEGGDEGEEEEEEEEEIIPENAMFYTGFENGADGFGVDGSGYNSGVIVNKEEDANVYKGSHALKLAGYSRNMSIIEDKSWITNGDFFTYKAYVKLGEGDKTRAAAELVLWSADENGANWTQDVKLLIMPHTNITGSEWVELNYVFGVYGNGQTIYAYHNNGVLEEIDATNNYIAKQVYFDLLAQNGTLYFDNVVIEKTSVKKDAVVGIFDRAGNAITGANLIVKDADGNALEVQPEITENEGVYTIKGLEYSNFAQKYTISYDIHNLTVDFVNSEREINLDSVEGEEDLGEPIFSIGFEDGLNGFAAEEGGSGSCVIDNENSHEGTNSLKVNGIWTRKEFNDGWIQGGQFFKFSAWAKIASGSPQACAQMYIWGAKDETNWKMCNTRICALTYTTISAEWTYVSGIFGVYSDGTTAYAYHNNGVLEELSEIEGYNIAYKVVFDLGATVGGSIYYDEVSVVPVNAYKDANVTVYGVENPEIVVCDENGVALEKQPRIVEEEGVYTVRGLAYANFAQKYIVKVYDNGEEYGSQEVSFIDSEILIASPFNATVTVKDVNGNPVTDAVISYGDVTVTENVDGVYTLANLLTITDVTVLCEGLLPGFAVVTPDEKEAVVVVKEERAVNDVSGNKLFDGNFEDGFAHNLMKQNADAVITNKDQYSGKKSMMIVGNDVGARILARTTGIDVNGVVYYLEVMAKSTNNAIFSIGGIVTGYDADGNYCYPTVISDIVALTEEWQRISITFSFRHDPVTNKMYMSINGEDEVEFNKSYASTAAFDMSFVVSDGGIVYIDDIVLLETYTGVVTVKGEDGNLLEDATFVVTDFAGNTLDITPDYNPVTNEYIFENLAGNVTVVATAGGKTYSAVTLSKALNSIQIESSYTITLTLKDQYGQAVVGAIVYARKLLTTVGTFVDNGDGTYTLTEAMGTITIVVVADGYSFSRQDGVTADNAVLTMVGENYGEPEPSEPETSEPDESKDSNTSTSSGCLGSVSAMSMLAIPALFAAAGIIFKKKED